MKDRSIYNPGKTYMGLNAIAFSLVFLFVGKIFFGEYLYGAFLFVLIIPALKYRKKVCILKKKREQSERFKVMLNTLAEYMDTGNSFEKALIYVKDNLERIYGKEAKISVLVENMINEIRLGTSSNNAIEHFSERIELDEARLFYEVFTAAKSSGSNIEKTIREVAGRISMTQEIRNNIEVSVFEKKVEQKIMICMPVFMILYMYVSSPGFLDVMYETIIGRIIMAACLLVYILAIVWSEKIAGID